MKPPRSISETHLTSCRWEARSRAGSAEFQPWTHHIENAAVASVFWSCRAAQTSVDFQMWIFRLLHADSVNESVLPRLILWWEFLTEPHSPLRKTQGTEAALLYQRRQSAEKNMALRPKGERIFWNRRMLTWYICPTSKQWAINLTNNRSSQIHKGRSWERR